jgi:hypothetical protein
MSTGVMAPLRKLSKMSRICPNAIMQATSKSPRTPVPNLVLNLVVVAKFSTRVQWCTAVRYIVMDFQTIDRSTCSIGGAWHGSWPKIWCILNIGARAQEFGVRRFRSFIFGLTCIGGEFYPGSLKNSITGQFLPPGPLQGFNPYHLY